MWADIVKKQTAMAARYVKSQRHTIQVDYVPFMDELAEHVGCKPHFGKYPKYLVGLAQQSSIPSSICVIYL